MVSFVHSYYTLSVVKSFNLPKKVQQVFCISHQSINLTPCSKQNAWSAQSTTLFGIPEYIHFFFAFYFISWRIRCPICEEKILTQILIDRRLRMLKGVPKIADFLKIREFLNFENQSKKIGMFTFKDLTLTLSVKKFETATCSEPRNSRIIYYL